MASKIDILTSGYAYLVAKPDTSDCGSSASSSKSSQAILATKVEQQTLIASNLRNSGDKYMRATGSCCLVRSSGSYILFDTMGPWERDLLIDSLAKLNVHPDDINYLVCSHSHPDHVGNLNLFSRAKRHFVGTSVYSNDLYDLNCFEPIRSYTYKSPKEENELEVITYQNYKLDSNLSLEPTQGHTMECISMLVKNCEQYNSVALVGDLFENEYDVEDDSVWLSAGSQNSHLQRANRTRIYNSVDYILPGHGPLFATKSTKLLANF